MRRAAALLPTLSRLGRSRLVPATSHLPAPDAAKVEALNTLDDRPLAGLSSNGIHRTAESTHTGLLEDVDPAAESVRAITESHRLGAQRQTASHKLAAAPSSVRILDGIELDQGDPEIADLGQQAVQLSLVQYESGDRGRAVVLVAHLEVVEPGGPVGVEMPLDAEDVARRNPATRPRHQDPTKERADLDGAAMRRPMTYSTTAKLMTQPAPRAKPLDSSPSATTPSAKPWVKTWVPAPAASA